MKIILVTGGLGFIGKYFVIDRLSIGDIVINIDAVTYAADRTIINTLDEYDNYQFTRCRIENLEYLPVCDLIVNFAAESHVDNSILYTNDFAATNIYGVYNLLELINKKPIEDRPRLLHISTDEVYGDIIKGSFVETDKLTPSNPYSATKAAADMLIQGWGRTFKLNYNIVRMSNVYGPHQYPEKLIPKTCMRVKMGKPAIVHGDGSYQRSWLHTDDAINAINVIIEKGVNKEIYNIAGNVTLSNLHIVKSILSKFGVDETFYKLVPNRIGQDVRYSLDDEKIKKLGWKPEADFDKKLDDIIGYLDVKRFTQPWESGKNKKSATK